MESKIKIIGIDRHDYWVGKIYEDYTWTLVVNEEDAGHFSIEIANVFKDIMSKRCSLGVELVALP